MHWRKRHKKTTTGSLDSVIDFFAKLSEATLAHWFQSNRATPLLVIDYPRFK